MAQNNNFNTEKIIYKKLKKNEAKYPGNLRKVRIESLAEESFSKNTAKDFVKELRKFIVNLELRIKIATYDVIKNIFLGDAKKLLENTKYSGALSS